MKLFFCTCLCLLSYLNINAQVTLEQTYVPPSGEFLNTGAMNINQCTTTYVASLFKIVSTDNAGEKYVYMNPNTLEVKFYNLDHSIYKTLTMGFPAGTQLYDANIFYVSENLFDLDNGLEFLLCVNGGAAIIEETGVVSASFTGIVKHTSQNHLASSYTQEFPGIVNTSNGTKMLVYHKNSSSCTNGLIDSVSVYSLPGSLATVPTGFTRSAQEKEIELYNSPNPAILFTKIHYKLPAQISEATLTIFDVKGRELSQYAIDQNFDHLRISTQDLPTGTYYYSLSTDTGVIQSKKMIVVH